MKKRKGKNDIGVLCDDVFEEKETRKSFQHVLVRNENSIVVFYLSAVIVVVFSFFQFPRLFLLILYIASVRMFADEVEREEKAVETLCCVSWMKREVIQSDM